jgi:glutathione S-transferase
MENCRPYLEEYGTKRLPKYLDFLEAALRRSAASASGGNDNDNDNGNGGPFLVGKRLTTADLAAWHYLCALEVHYKEHYERELATRPLLREFKDRIASRPRIAAYLASGRSPPWDADSLM